MLLKDRYDYQPGQDKIGEGKFSKVYKAYDTLLNMHVALKFVDQTSLPAKYNLVEEIRKAIPFNHPNLVKYYDMDVIVHQKFTGESQKIHVGIMEYVAGGSLSAFLGSNKEFPFRQKKNVALGILHGLSYLHKRKVIHRDLTASNILLQFEGGEAIPKIVDFGISKQLSGDFTAVSSVSGAYEYLSPEMLGVDGSKGVGIQTDLWSFGVILYEMFTGELPFGSKRQGVKETTIISNILSVKLPEKMASIPEPFQLAIRRCLVRNPEQRAKTAEDIMDMLDYPILETFKDAANWLFDEEKDQEKARIVLAGDDPENSIGQSLASKRHDEYLKAVEYFQKIDDSEESDWMKSQISKLLNITQMLKESEGQINKLIGKSQQIQDEIDKKHSEIKKKGND